MFSIIEFWTTEAGGSQQTIVYPKSDKDEAMSSYHYVLHLAAVSAHYKHGALLIDDEGRYLARECFTHVEPEITPELAGNEVTENVEG